MRVIAGSARGHKLSAPEGVGVRPTADKIKGSLFNMINLDIYDCNFLDLFSGTGAIGIEALSRGAGYCAFVEKSGEHCTYIYKNLDHVKKAVDNDNYTVINRDVSDAFPVLKDKKIKFDIIFMDPPYNKGLINRTIDDIRHFDLLNEDGYIVVEQGSDEEEPVSQYFEIYKKKIYRTAAVYFLR